MSSKEVIDPGGQKGRRSGGPSSRDESETFAAEGDRIRLNISFARSRQPQSKVYIQEYATFRHELSREYVFPEKLNHLIPRGIHEFVDEGENYFERAIRALYSFGQCGLVGPSGTGKTHLAFLISEVANLPLWEVNCGYQTSSEDLFGKYTSKDTWVDGPVLSWCRNGGLLLLDEVNMLRPDVVAKLNPLLDSRAHIVLNEKEGEVFRRHQAGYVLAMMNPYSSEFAGTRPLNLSFKRRISVWISFDYLSVGNRISEKEISLVEKRGKVSRQVAIGMVQIASQLRKMYNSNDLPYAPSVGDLVNWASLVYDGVPAARAAEDTIVSMTSEDREVKDTVRRVIQLVFSGRESSTR